jgi:hypothetical protein
MNLLPKSEKHFAWFKFTVYGLLVINTVMFFQQEQLASDHTFNGSVPLLDLISAFSATIDTAAWVLLLLLFELETRQIPHHKWVPPLSTTVHLVRMFCYVFIVYAFYGYLISALELYQYAAAAIAQPCALANQGYSMLVTLDEYITLSAGNCTQYAGMDLFRFGNSKILATTAILNETRWLAWVDVINSATWILVCVVLEVDVRLQDRNMLRGRVLATSSIMKMALYATLFCAAVYWGYAGEFLDFWDAFLWLVAFVFIEMNVVQWNEELTENV